MLRSILRISFIIIFSSMVLTQAHIAIDIEPEEMQRIAEILVENYLTHNLSPHTTLTRNGFFLRIKKVSICAVQLIGITVSLVSANLLTSILDPFVVPPTTMAIASNVNNITASAYTPTPSQLCNREFGCDRNVCWRSCDAGSSVHLKNSTHVMQSWCYTTPNQNARKYQQCIYPHDCSPCWECLGECNSKAWKI